jgi:hypothetical protein
LVPQPQPEKDISTVETQDEIAQDVAQHEDVQISIDLAVKDGGSTYPEDQVSTESSSPFSVTNVPSFKTEEEQEGSEQGSVVETSSQQKTDFPDIEQPPVSRDVSGEAPTTLESPALSIQLKNGITIQVIGEFVYDLGPDGTSLRPRSSYRDYTSAALKHIVTRSEDLRTRWLSKEQRQALLDQLQEEGVDVQVLATALHLPNVDPLDVLLHVAFGQREVTRGERV